MKNPIMNKKDFFKAIKQISDNNLITEEEIYEIIDQAVKKSFHSKFDPDAELDLKIDPATETFELINKSKMVVEDEVEDEFKAIDISLKDAQKINPKVKIGDTVSQVVNFAIYSQSIASLIRQLITQNVKEKKKKAIYEKHKDLIGQMINVTVVSSSLNHAILSLDDKTIAFMPSRYKNPKIALSPGQRISVYVEDVLAESKDAQVIVSNGSKQIVKTILEQEVPEIADGIVEIVSISRMPSLRTKVAVKSTDENVDPVGAIIGARGSRISQIIDKIDGEKIDIIPFSEDLNLFVGKALAPAKVVSVVDKLDEEGKAIEGYKVAITPNSQQTLAIGKMGSNARLAVELTNVRVDVISLEQAKNEGIEVIWNQNIGQHQLEAIENGERINNFNNKSNNYSSMHQNIQLNDFDLDIQSFSEEISSQETSSIDPFAEEKETITEKDHFNEEDIFSSEELEKMQEDFELDDDFNFGNDNENEYYNIDDNEE